MWCSATRTSNRAAGALAEGVTLSARAAGPGAGGRSRSPRSRGAALGYFDGLVPVWQGDTLHQVRARRHVLATGAIQQPMVFHEQRPARGDAVGRRLRLAALYAVKPGKRAAVVAGSTTVD